VRTTDPSGAYVIASTTVAITGASGVQFGTQPGNGQAGQPLAPQPVVRVVDANGAVVPAYTGPVTLAFGTNAGAGVLGGTITLNAVNGVATFTNLFVNAAGNGYTLIASSGGLTTATSAPFNVSPAPPPGPCSPRPNVQVQTSRVGPGQIRATVSGGQGGITGVLRLGQPDRPLVNATVDVDGGPAGITSAQDVPITGGVMTFTVTRTGAGAVMVPITVTDGCGEWRSFVGFGPGM
jgi:hypothetical protein